LQSAYKLLASFEDVQQMNELVRETYRFCLCEVYIRYDGDGKQVLKAVYYRVRYGGKRRVVDGQ